MTEKPTIHELEAILDDNAHTTRIVYRTVGGVSTETMMVVALISLALGMVLGGLGQ